MSSIQDIDYNVDLLRAILWQYEESGRLKTLIQRKQDWVNRVHSAFWSQWYIDVFNIDTANKFGLAVWGRILNIALGVDQPPQPAKISFGFGANHTNFNNGNFGVLSTSTQPLSLEQQRMLIRMRYFQITCRPTVPEINEFFAYLFAVDGPAYVVDHQDMTMTYVFGFAPSSELQYILQNFDFLPRPSGVRVNWISFSRKSFGFGPDNLNFNNGNFGA